MTRHAGAGEGSCDNILALAQDSVSFHAMTTADAMAELVTLVQRAHTLGTIGDLLGWDEQVNLPAGAAEQRAHQHAVLAGTHHAAASEPRLGELLTLLEGRANR